MTSEASRLRDAAGSCKEAALPPYPQPSPSSNRLEHRPTIEQGLIYWRAVVATARQRGDTLRQRVAESLCGSYAAALRRLDGDPDNAAPAISRLRVPAQRKTAGSSPESRDRP